MNDKNRQATGLARRARWAAAAAVAAAAVAACGGGGGAATESTAASGPELQSTATTTAAAPDHTGALSTGVAVALAKTSTKPVAQPKNTEGRLLASNCFQCHGTLGSGGFEAIRGQEASEVMEFMSKTASKDIMAAHAQGYTPAQLQKIINYLQQ